ncbi:MAG: T9SS type A sorting domain-containing protein [Candidatus Sabulitectum sp.]|nr:T9SS type A sorting domain-containing protein [Candidatus Sabulitectum sp.]
MRITCAKPLIILLFLTYIAGAYSFYDDFEDNDISDWEIRCAGGNWSASSGMVHGNISTSPGALVPLNGCVFLDCTVSVEATGVHAFGVLARLTEEDFGILAYVSPDNNVARIRLVENGNLGATLNSFSTSFPSGVTYSLSFTCVNNQLTFQISVPSTNQSWEFSATDPNPQTGVCGLHMGDEPNASWDWIEVEGTEIGNAEITWLVTDDQNLGNGDFAFEPGEIIDLDIELTNTSDEPLLNAFGILQSLSPELTVIEDYVTYGTIASGESTYGLSSFVVLTPLATPPDEVYDMRLTLMADGGYQEQLPFSLPVGSGLACNVESGSDGWTWGAIQGGWANDWHVSSERNYTPEGQYSFKCGDSGSGDYSNHHFGYLLSPYINLPLGSEINFWMWIDAQTEDLPEALDGGIVQYGRCDSWIDLFPASGYTHQITAGSSGPFEDGTGVFSGTVPWTQYCISLPDSLAGPGQIRFVFGSDTYGTREGWYIDEINMGDPTSTEEESEQQLFTDPLLSVSANPFHSSVTFSYLLPGVENSSLDIFDLHGRQITIFEITAGDQTQTVNWNGRDSSGNSIPCGVYLARLRGHDQSTVKLIKI